MATVEYLYPEVFLQELPVAEVVYPFTPPKPMGGAGGCPGEVEERHCMAGRPAATAFPTKGAMEF